MIFNSSSNQHSQTVSGKFVSILGILFVVTFCQTLQAQNKVNVSSLQKLREAIQKDNQTIVMKPGKYALTDLPKEIRNLPVSGSNNTINLTGVYVAALVDEVDTDYVSILGNGNVFEGGTFEDVYKNGLVEVTDFSAYNKNRELASGLRGTCFVVRGNDNKVINTKLTVRGSFPYGYGSIYGINAENGFGLKKRSGLLVNGKRNLIDGCEIQHRAFGHGIYIQKPAEETVLKNCLVEGAMRPSNDLYLETDPEDLPFRSKYRMKNDRNKDDGPPIPKDIMIPLSEDGIRVYKDGGSVTVENCTVKKMRGGIRLYLSSGANVSNCTAIDCGRTNFNLPTRGRITGSTGNFAFAPLINFPGSKSGETIELTIAPSPHFVGSHNIADIDGRNHNIVFHRLSGPIDTNLRPIIVSASNSTIRNETEYPITLEASATKNTIFSFGPVTGNTRENMVKRIKQTASNGNSPKEQYRIWERNDGVKVFAKLIAKKGSSVTLAMVDGERVTGRLNDLSKLDREFISDLNAAPQTKTKKKEKKKAPAGEPPIRTWTSTFGSSIEARLVSKKGDSVVLEKADGSNLTVPLNKLSKADQAYVDQQ